MHEASVQDREDGTEKAELIIVHSLLQPKSRGTGSREISAARMIPSSLPATPKAIRSPTCRSEPALLAQETRGLTGMKTFHKLCS